MGAVLLARPGAEEAVPGRLPGSLERCGGRPVSHTYTQPSSEPQMRCAQFGDSDAAVWVRDKVSGSDGGQEGITALSRVDNGLLLCFVLLITKVLIPRGVDPCLRVAVQRYPVQYSTGPRPHLGVGQPVPLELALLHTAAQEPVNECTLGARPALQRHHPRPAPALHHSTKAPQVRGSWHSPLPPRPPSAYGIGTCSLKPQHHLPP